MSSVIVINALDLTWLGRRRTGELGCGRTPETVLRLGENYPSIA
ncbi:hypothetical protein [Nocardia macrotermitis]|nr:hypothetical protein [Nocardia macrotermitis]